MLLCRSFSPSINLSHPGQRDDVGDTGGRGGRFQKQHRFSPSAQQVHENPGFARVAEIGKHDHPGAQFDGAVDFRPGASIQGIDPHEYIRLRNIRRHNPEVVQVMIGEARAARTVLAQVFADPLDIDADAVYTCPVGSPDHFRGAGEGGKEELGCHYSRV